MTVAHHPWRDRNTPRGRQWHAQLGGRSSPLEGSQPEVEAPSVDPELGRSSPLEGSQLRSSASILAVIAWVAHHPWRDRNPNCPPTSASPSPVAHHPWRDRNATPPARPSPSTTRRSSPLEGSQPRRIATVESWSAVAHHPWRDRNGTQTLSSLFGVAVAHHPWRDRNPRGVLLRITKPGRSSPLEGSQHGDPAQTAISYLSLITPGGIATDGGGDAGDGLFGSLITPGGIATALADGPGLPRDRRRSSPLEGSQHAGHGHRPGGRVQSLITPGGIATSARGSRPGCACRSSPLEGSQQATVTTWTRTWWVAHHPWRDRNTAKPSGP